MNLTYPPHFNHPVTPLTTTNVSIIYQPLRVLLLWMVPQWWFTINIPPKEAGHMLAVDMDTL